MPFHNVQHHPFCPDQQVSPSPNTSQDTSQISAKKGPRKQIFFSPCKPSPSALSLAPASRGEQPRLSAALPDSIPQQQRSPSSPCREMALRARRSSAVRCGAAGAAEAKEALRFSCSFSFPGDAAEKSLLLSP